MAACFAFYFLTKSKIISDFPVKKVPNFFQIKIPLMKLSKMIQSKNPGENFGILMSNCMKNTVGTLVFLQMMKLKKLKQSEKELEQFELKHMDLEKIV